MTTRFSASSGRESAISRARANPRRRGYDTAAFVALPPSSWMCLPLRKEQCPCLPEHVFPARKCWTHSQNRGRRFARGSRRIGLHLPSSSRKLRSMVEPLGKETPTAVFHFVLRIQVLRKVD
jgi:hypothetical protein